MRKLGISFLIIICFLLAIGITLQTDWARKKVQALFIETAASQGVTFETESIEGTLPFTIAFTNLSITSEELTLKIEKLKARLSLFALFHRFIQIPSLEAEGVSWKTNPEAASKAPSLPTFRIEVEHLHASRIQINDSLTADFTGKLNLSKKGIFVAKGIIKANELEPWDISGRINFPKQLIESKISGKMNDASFAIQIAKQGSSNWEIQKSSLKNQTLSLIAKGFIRSDGSIENLRAVVKETNAHFLGAFRIETSTSFPFEGKMKAAFSILELPWKGSSDFSWDWKKPLQLSQLVIQGPSLACTGDITIQPNLLITGHTKLDVQNLNTCCPPFYGMLSSEMNWEIKDNLQTISHVTEGTDLYYKDLFIQNLALNGLIIDPGGFNEGTLFARGVDLKWKELSLTSIQMQTVSMNPNDYSFALAAFGKWKKTLDIQLSGSLQYEAQNLICNLQHGAGNFYTHPFSLLQPVSLQIASDIIKLDALNLQVDNGGLLASITRTPEIGLIELELKQFPLDLLSLNPLDVEIQGNADLSLRFKEDQETKTGGLHFAFKELAATSLAGTVEGHLQNDQCSLTVDIHYPSSPLLKSQLSFPCDLSLRSFNVDFLDQPMKGNLSFQGKIAPLLDFLNFGSHRLEGDVIATLNIHGTPFFPLLGGALRLENGYYENYFTGTQLFDLQGVIEADQDRLVIKSLSALDGPKKGDFQLTGELFLHPQNSFPFSLDAQLKRFTSAQIDLVSAETEGNIHISGNQKGANIQGTIQVIESDLNIPDKIPRLLPDLEVTYKNQIKPLSLPSLPSQNHYPLHLNMNVIAPDSIFIDGRGLLSEWKGDFLLHGDYDAPSMEGNLSLIQGNFAFSGRKFRLTKGILSFSGVPSEMPALDLTGVMDLNDLSIIANLKGPLNNPQILLQSTPPLPLSSIMSYLLFGRDLAEINSFQALELANSLASIAGEGSQVLEKTRKALGVDRIEIVSKPGSSDSDELEQTIALQVGKYVSEGVFVSFTQGAEDASGNISIEIDLKHGFILELESDQRQEQGKFTLKWARSY